MAATRFKKIAFYYRPDIKDAPRWEKKLTHWIRAYSPQTRILPLNAIPTLRKNAPELLIVLGGDGTVLEAAQKFQRWNPLIFGLNLGHVGFLASVRNPKHFIAGLSRVFRRKYRPIPHMLIHAAVLRRGKMIFSAYGLNDVAIQNLLGIVDISVWIEGQTVQQIHGTGILVSTATGSTAYNLSAHGPIVMPDIKCLIVTELLDHSIPTPSLIIKRNRTVTLKIENFRKRDQFIVKKTGEPADVVLSTDTERVIALHKGDVITVRKSERLIRFVELEKNYFFKSLQEKFAFK